MDVLDLFIDEANELKLASHGVSVREALQVLSGAYRVMRNESEARGGAPFVLIGPTKGGRFLTMPIDPSFEETVWRPRTAYDSRPREIARYRRHP